jgi:hypothetical protein
MPAAPARVLLNFAVNHFALPYNAPFIRDGCIPTPFVFQILASLPAAPVTEPETFVTSTQSNIIEQWL